MNWCKHLGAFVVLLMGVCAPAAAEKILFIPLDNRPVSLAYTADSFRKAGVQVVTPPESLLASDRQSGDPEKLARWLDQEARGARGAVVSVDSYIYGGLVPSRTHELDSAVLARRAEDLLAFQSRHPGVPLYAFATVMRSPSCIWVTTRYLVPWSMANTTAASTRALSQAVRPLRMRDARPVLSAEVSAVRTGAEDSA